jgi:hypothetical protein
MEKAQENLRDGIQTHEDDLGHPSNSYSAVSAKKESQTLAQPELVVNDPFDLKSMRVSSVHSDNQKDSSSNLDSSD